MAENKLGIGKIILPAGMDKDLKIAMEDLVRRADDNVNYLMKPSVNSKAENYEATDLDSLILSDATDAARTVTLPPASQNRGKQLKIKKTDSSANTVTISGKNGETIDGSASKVLSNQNEVTRVISDGEKWHIV